MDGETAKETLEAMSARAHFVRQQGNGELWRVSGSGRKQWDRWRLIVVGGEVVTVLPPFGDGNKKPPRVNGSGYGATMATAECGESTPLPARSTAPNARPPLSRARRHAPTFDRGRRRRS